MKRALAGRFYVEGRANSKAMKAAIVVKCPVSTYTQKPDYPGPGSAANNEAAGNAQFAASYATASHWTVPAVSLFPCKISCESWWLAEGFCLIERTHRKIGFVKINLYASLLLLQFVDFICDSA